MNNINGDFSQMDKAISDLKTILPTHVDLGVNKRIYDMFIGSSVEKIINQLNTGPFNYSVNAYVKNVSVLANSDNFITVSSILSYLVTIANQQINIFFLKIFIALLIPIIAYIISTFTFVLIIVKKEKKSQSKNGT